MPLQAFCPRCDYAADGLLDYENHMRGHDWIDRMTATFALGLAEAAGNVGMTYDDPLRSDAYDYGRTLGRKGLGLE